MTADVHCKRSFHVFDRCAKSGSESKRIGTFFCVKQCVKVARLNKCSEVRTSACDIAEAMLPKNKANNDHWAGCTFESWIVAWSILQLTGRMWRSKWVTAVDGLEAGVAQCHSAVEPRNETFVLMGRELRGKLLALFKRSAGDQPRDEPPVRPFPHGKAAKSAKKPKQASGSGQSHLLASCHSSFYPTSMMMKGNWRWQGRWRDVVCG